MNDDPRVEHLLENVNIFEVLTQLGVIPYGEIQERNIVCPFHAFGRERKPSGRAYHETDQSPSGAFYCFTCGRTWNPIMFVKDFKNISFWEAVRWLEKIFEVTPPSIERVVERTARETPSTPVEVKTQANTPLLEGLELIDMLMRKGRRMLSVKQFRLYSDISDLLRYQIEVGSEQASQRVQQFLTKIKKEMGASL